MGFKASKTLSGIETKTSAAPSYRYHASKPLKPFQGLKLQSDNYDYGYKDASKPLKPFQGLKQKKEGGSFQLLGFGFKASKTLSGIETGLSCASFDYFWCFKASKTLSGIETIEYSSSSYFPISLQSL